MCVFVLVVLLRCARSNSQTEKMSCYTKEKLNLCITDRNGLYWVLNQFTWNIPTLTYYI